MLKVTRKTKQVEIILDQELAERIAALGDQLSRELTAEQVTEAGTNTAAKRTAKRIEELKEQAKDSTLILTLRAAVVERFSEVADVADCLASAGGERVGDLRSLAAGQVEHRQCVGHVFCGVAHGHAVRGGEVEGSCQAAGEYVGDAHAGLAEVVDRVG